MPPLFKHLKGLDWVLIVSSVILVGLGLLAIYSSSLGRGDFLNFKKQIIFFVIGIILMFLFSFFDYRVLRNDPHLILILYFFCIIALFGLFFFAPLTRGVKAWYRFGPISFDPIEPTKLIFIMMLSKYFSMRHIEMYRIRHILLSGFYLFIPAFLIFRQPDFGSVLILICLWTGILIVSGIKLRHFLFLILFGLLFSVLSWSFLLHDYQKERIMGFIEPKLEPLGTAWSQTQSKIAIGAGGIFGQGWTHGSQTQYGFLPEPQTDFIFAAIAEEFGLIGVTILLILFLIILWRIFKIALSAQTNFPRLFASGFAILLMSQIFINIGMNLGILPIIGIPLPFVSYGGSNLILTFLALGIIQSLKRPKISFSDR